MAKENKKAKQPKNLLTRHKTRDSDGGYYSFNQVRQIVDNYETLNAAYSNK